jgi:hypothetical protein
LGELKLGVATFETLKQLKSDDLITIRLKWRNTRFDHRQIGRTIAPRRRNGGHLAAFHPNSQFAAANVTLPRAPRPSGIVFWTPPAPKRRRGFSQK